MKNTIPQPVINSFQRVGIDHTAFDNEKLETPAINRFTGEFVITTELLSALVKWVYKTNNDYEQGVQTVNLSDFDRIKYFVLKQQPKVYSACLD